MGRKKIETFKEKVLYKFAKKNLIYDYNYYCNRKKGHALLYYKTFQFVLENRFVDLRKSSIAYTSNWEEVEIARVLNRLGFWVDIVDRSIDRDFMPENKYDIFIGNGAGNSGKYYAKYAKHLTKAVRLFYANGPEPALGNKLQQERYVNFNQRHPNYEMPFLRMITEVDIHESMEYTDGILCFGNEFSINSYKKFNKPIFQIIPSSSSALTTDIGYFKEKDRRKFLYFGGAGNLVKGVDLIIEAFDELPNVDLYICAPYEEEFNTFYKHSLEKDNIHYLGFIDVGGPVFDELTQKCGYQLFLSSSEGTSTAVITCMRRGLIPVVTYETGVDVDDFGYLVQDLSIEAIRNKIIELSELPKKEFNDRTVKTYIASQKYTEDAFSKNYENMILKAIMDINPKLLD
jgi:glycosyltransferase involved in cell wall biosynthesis